MRYCVLNRRRLISSAALAAASSYFRPAAAGSPTRTLDFVTHASFFSGELNLPKVVDPHVFVVDPAAAEAVGPQNIRHAAGYRPATPEDRLDQPVFTAVGKPLGFSLQAWFAAEGTVTLEPAAEATTSISCFFSNLCPGGVYDLFENHFNEKPVGFTPLDGTATANGFVAGADGTARILLVYHSDGMRHGMSRGEIGVTAHHQIIARVPA